MRVVWAIVLPALVGLSGGCSTPDIAPLNSTSAQPAPTPSDVDSPDPLLRAEALLLLGRVEEAVQVLEYAASRNQDFRRSTVWKGLSTAARVGEGVHINRSDEELRFRGDERLSAGMRRLEDAVPLAMEAVRRRLGDPTLRFPAMGIYVVDGEEIRFEGAMGAYLVWRGGEPVCLICVDSAVLVFPWGLEVTALAHEMVHVLHLSGPGGEEAPDWLSEGLAHWVESEDETILREMVLARGAEAGMKGRPRLSAGLEDPTLIEREGDPLARTAGALFFFHLERTRGTVAVRKIALRLLQESDADRVFVDETGRDVVALRKELAEGFKVWVDEMFPGLDTISSVSESVRAGGRDEALQALDRFETDFPDSPARPVADLLRVQALATSGDWESARNALGPLRALRLARPGHPLVPHGLTNEIHVLRGARAWIELASLLREARESSFGTSPKWCEWLAEVLAEAEAQLEASVEIAPPPSTGESK